MALGWNKLLLRLAGRMKRRFLFLEIRIFVTLLKRGEHPLIPLMSSFLFLPPFFLTEIVPKLPTCVKTEVFGGREHGLGT